MSAEVPYSAGIAVAHMAASAETVALRHETISPDLMVNGITKLEDLQSAELLRQIGLPAHAVPSYLAEAQQVLGLLQTMGVEPRRTRHALRERLGDGGYTRSPSRSTFRARTRCARPSTAPATSPPSTICRL